MVRPAVGSLVLIAVFLACGVASILGHGTVAAVGIIVGALLLVGVFGAGIGRVSSRGSDGFSY